MQNLGSFRPLGAILGAPSHTKLDFAIPLLKTTHKMGLGKIRIFQKNIHPWSPPRPSKNQRSSHNGLGNNA